MPMMLDDEGNFTTVDWDDSKDPEMTIKICEHSSVSFKTLCLEKMTMFKLACRGLYLLI